MDTNNKFKLYVLIGLLTMWAAGAAAAPIISYEEPTTLNDSCFIITWQTTNEPGTTGIQYGIAEATTTYVTDEGRVNNHYLVLNNLYPNTTYKYRIFSTNGSGQTTYGDYKVFTTLVRPSGEFLYSFAVISDPQIATGEADTYGARGRPYSQSHAILSSAVDLINRSGVDFTVVKGDLIDAINDSPATEAANFKTIIDNLDGPVYPLPGNHDKAVFPAHAGDTDDWYNQMFKNIRTNPSAEAAPTANSIYNYSTSESGFHFVFLDSVKNSPSLDGLVDTNWLAADLAAHAGERTFIFMHYVITPESASQIPSLVIEEVIGAESIDWNKIDLTNRGAFLSVLASYESDIAGVFMGHIHDNSRYYIAGLDFPFVRTASTAQFPIGYNIYKVYSNGYMQSFYKIPGYCETSRDNVTGEGGYSDVYWELQSMGTNYDRNFTITSNDFAAVTPTITSLAPVNNSTGVALNQAIKLTFSQPMSTTETTGAVSFSPALTGASYSWNSAKTILTIGHSALTDSTTYTMTVDATAKSANDVNLAAVSFSFRTGSATDTTAPAATLAPLTNNFTTDPTPTLIGVASDENSTITNVEYRIASGSWSDWRSTTPLDGAFDSTTEAFSLTVTPEVTRERHTIQLRTTNAAGVVTTSGYSEYSFYMLGTNPLISLTADGNEIVDGDPIIAAPSFEVIVAAASGITNTSRLIFRLNGAAQTATSLSQANGNTLTYAFYNPTLTAGTYIISVEATDNEGNVSTKEVTNLLVQTAGAAELLGTPLNYPNPFNAGAENTTISYTLTKSSTVTLRIFDLAGNVVNSQTFPSGTTGGKAGYNEVTWDGKSGGITVGNGIYVYLVIADGTVPSNGKGKITVAKR